MEIKKLTVENAQIKTASVEVKTLTISGKQVTLVVFRQTPHEEYPRDHFMRYVIWGELITTNPNVNIEAIHTST